MHQEDAAGAAELAPRRQSATNRRRGLLLSPERYDVDRLAMLETHIVVEALL